MKRKLWTLVTLMLTCGMLTACGDARNVESSERMPESEETQIVVETETDEATTELECEVELDYDEDGLPFVKNQIWVFTYPGTDEKIMGKQAEEIEADVIEYLPDMDFYLLEFRKDTPCDELTKYVNFFLAHSFVMDAELNYYFTSEIQLN